MEAKFAQASLFKRLLDSLTALIDQATLDCGADGLSLQAMDSAHVALVALNIPVDAFEEFRCDRNLSLGLDLGVVSKIVRTAGNDDALTIKASPNSDSICVVLESRDRRKVSEFNVRRMNLDAEHLGIPDTDYDAVVRLSSSELQRVVRDLGQIGESVVVDVDKEGVSFAAQGDLASGCVKLAQTGGAGGDAAAASSSAARNEDAVVIELQEKTRLTFALKYLSLFTRATSLSPRAKLSLSLDVPLVLEYAIGETGYIRFYLAPKMDDDDD